jgi:uncharacterized repeat protein (TIGR03803 family)
MTCKAQFGGKLRPGICATLTLSLMAATPLAAILVFTAFIADTCAAAQTETVLHNLAATSQTTSGLVRNAAGNLYGTTQNGGLYGYGTVFEVSPPAAGSTVWTTKTIHVFGTATTDGQYPSSPNLVFDSAGNLYGTTSQGGAFGGGTVFELTLQPAGGWAEIILYRFGTGKGPNDPSGVVFDGTGNLYGTSGGGLYGDGTVFELSPKTGGGWGVKVLHNLGAGPKDGTSPMGNLVIDGAGNLYGTTFMGGAHPSSGVGGAVFELMPPASGRTYWAETILHSFGVAPDGNDPIAGLVMDGAGNLYGTTFNGGLYGGSNTGGTVFEVSPTPGGGWTETVLHNFSENHVDGFWPCGSLTLDSAGNLYGTASAGGSEVDSPTYVLGVAFELSPPAAGSTTWTEAILHPFGAGKDGQYSSSNLILDNEGSLFGTTNRGGTLGGGAVFEVTP